MASVNTLFDIYVTDRSLTLKEEADLKVDPVASLSSFSTANWICKDFMKLAGMTGFGRFPKCIVLSTLVLVSRPPTTCFINKVSVQVQVVISRFGLR